MAAAIITGVPTLIVYILAGNYFIKGLTAGSVKG
jgi:glucose/mannose transport system permease protein